MASFANICVASNASKVGLVSQGHPFWQYATAILVPTEGPPRTVSVKVAPQLDKSQEQDAAALESFVALSSSYLQGNTMTLLSGEPGCDQFAMLRQATAERFPDRLRGPTPLNVADLPPGGWAMIIDSYRDNLDDGMLCDMFFLGGDNGHPLGVRLMKDLPLNQNLGSRVYGPVVIFAGQYADVDDMEYEALLDVPEAVLADTAAMRELLDSVKKGVAERYTDAGVIQ